uniref:Uncharacterized protein n=1 Tax=Avena sativa TaxID=4498 RepID=A0ACD5VAF3_AVESA
MGRPPCGEESGLKKGPWTTEEDEKLMSYIQKHGHGSWRSLPQLAGLNRCGKSCRLRWTNYLKPDIKRGRFSQEEEQTILQLHTILGNKWSAIAKRLPGRTDNEIKNFWNTSLRKKLIRMGIDPMTHRPRTDFFAALPQLIALASLRQLVLVEQQPWGDHTARLQAEAVQAANLQHVHSLLQSAPSIAPTTDLEQISFPSPRRMLSPSAPEGIGGVDLAGKVPQNQIPGITFDHTVGNIDPYSVCNVDESSEQNRGEGENSSQKRLFLSDENSLPPLTDMAVSNMCNSITASNYSGVSSPLPSWSDILLDEDLLMKEFS